MSILRDPVDCSLSGFSVHGILQARILEWATMPSSRGSSQPKYQPTSLMGSLPPAPPGKPSLGYHSCFLNIKWFCVQSFIQWFNYFSIQHVFEYYYISGTRDVMVNKVNTVLIILHNVFNTKCWIPIKWNISGMYGLPRGFWAVPSLSQRGDLYSFSFTSLCASLHRLYSNPENHFPEETGFGLK